MYQKIRIICLLYTYNIVQHTYNIPRSILGLILVVMVVLVVVAAVVMAVATAYAAATGVAALTVGGNVGAGGIAGGAGNFTITYYYNHCHRWQLFIT